MRTRSCCLSRRAAIVLSLVTWPAFGQDDIASGQAEADVTNATSNANPNASSPASADDCTGLTSKDGAWDESIRWENSGDLTRAQMRLICAYGDATDSYDIVIRLAWLAYRQADYAKAERLYRRASKLPGANDESARGIGATLIAQGKRDWDAGNLREARKYWRKALREPSSHEEALSLLASYTATPVIEPEVWGAYRAYSLGKTRNDGGAVFVQVPWNVSAVWRLRAAYRFVSSTTHVPRSPWSSAGRSGLSYPASEHEAYFGIGANPKYYGVDVLGVAMFPSDGSNIYGGGGRVRVGHAFGVLGDTAFLQQSSNRNAQAGGSLFYWPIQTIGLQTGLLATWDWRGSGKSIFGGASWIGRNVALHGRVHAGSEWWPVDVVSSSVVAIPAAFTSGVNGLMTVRVTEPWRLGLNAQVERLEVQGAVGFYYHIAAGIQWQPKFEGEER